MNGTGKEVRVRTEYDILLEGRRVVKRKWSERFEKFPNDDEDRDAEIVTLGRGNGIIEWKGYMKHK